MGPTAPESGGCRGEKKKKIRVEESFMVRKGKLYFTSHIRPPPPFFFFLFSMNDISFTRIIKKKNGSEAIISYEIGGRGQDG